MRAIILAAGIGARLRPLTDAIPKCLLPVGEIPLLQRTIGALLDHGVSGLSVVTGYRADQVRGFVERQFPGVPVLYPHNPLYASTNNIASLWCARGVEEEFLLLDSDIYFDPGVLGHLLASADGSALLLRSKGEIGEEEIKVELDGAGYVKRIGKELPASSAAGESIGIERFLPDEGRLLFRSVEELVAGQGRTDLFYEAAFQRAIDRGMAMKSVDVGNLACLEIDTPDDLLRARQLASPPTSSNP
jgi:choline kinase